MLEWSIGLLEIGKNRTVLHLVEPGSTRLAYGREVETEGWAGTDVSATETSCVGLFGLGHPGSSCSADV